MGKLYSVATRQEGLKRGEYAVVKGPVVKGTIDPRQIIQEFKDRPEADALAAKLNQESDSSN